METGSRAYSQIYASLNVSILEFRKEINIRAFEEKVDELFMRGEMHGTTHLSIGQEGTAVGAVSTLRSDDFITSTHRGHGHCITKGADISLMMAELLGKETGYCRGRGGSMHIADVENGNLGANGIVAGGMPIATGVGLSLKMQGTDRVCLCIFGDGAANEGAFHDPNVVIFLEHKALYNQQGMVPVGDWRVPLGKAEVKHKGKHLTIIALSIMVHRALAVADRLAKEGIEAEVIDPRSLRPLDEETLVDSVSNTGRVLIVQEAVLTGGFGGEIAARIAASKAFYYLDAPIMRLGGAEIPIPYQIQLEKRATPQEEDIYQAAQLLLRQKPA